VHTQTLPVTEAHAPAALGPAAARRRRLSSVANLAMAALATGWPTQAQTAHPVGSAVGQRPESTVPAESATSVRWNRLATRLNADIRRRAAATGPARLAIPVRLYVTLSAAQYEAAMAARAAAGTSQDTAIAAASAAVLAALMPDIDARTTVDAALAADVEGRKPHDAREAIDAGRQIGREAAQRLLAWSAGDGLDDEWHGTMPTEPGMWQSAPGVAPIGAAWPKARPWVLTRIDQFRPPPPPAYESAQFRNALDEVVAMGRRRTSEQTDLARKWVNTSAFVLWNAFATDALDRRRVTAADAARILALFNIAMNDAQLACWDAKYHYWLMRPSQRNPAVSFPDGMGLPNHPSYPSGHGCVAGAAEAVIGELLPQEATEASRLAAEAAESRLYAGAHYRFDNEIGLALGRTVARAVLDADRQGTLRRW
jgi:membrane-associated phospholipid phosphatase